MDGDNQSVRQLVEELSNAALRDLLRNVRHHTELRRRIAAGQLDEQDVNRAYRDYARREGGRYRRQAADLTLQYYSDLTDLGNRYSQRFYAEVLDDSVGFFARNGEGAPAPQATPGATGGAGQPAEEVPIELHGPPGREVMARFALENTEDHPVDLTLEVGPCTGADDEQFMAPLTVQPATLTLQPGESRSITLRLAVLASVFTPGFLYRLPVHVRGPGNLVLLVTIWAEEPDAGLAVEDAPAWRDAPVVGGGAAGEGDASVVGEALAESSAGVEEVPLVDGAPRAQVSPARPARAGRRRSAAAAATFVVRCPACRRDFARSVRSNRLYPHKTPRGEPCPERRGRLRTSR